MAKSHKVIYKQVEPESSKSESFLVSLICILLVVAVVSGFDFSIVKKDNLKGDYPDIGFEQSTHQFVQAASNGIEMSFEILRVTAEGMRTFFEVVSSDVPYYWDQEDQDYMRALLEIVDELSWWDRVKVYYALRVENWVTAPGFVEDLYYKYFPDASRGDEF